MSRIPIRIRLTAWFVLILAVTLFVLGTFVVTQLRSSLTDEVDRALTIAAADITQGYQEEGTKGFTDGTKEVIDAPGSRVVGALLWFGDGPVATSGEPLIPTTGPAPDFLRSAAGRVPATASIVSPSGTHLRAIAYPAPRATGVNGVLVVAEPLDEVDSAVRKATWLLLIGGAVALVLAGCAGWWLADRAMRPVARMTMRADAIDINDLRQRVPVPPADDELARLAMTLNAMLGRLKDGVEAKERLIADASHELRAPLAAMRAELDVSLRHDDLSDAERPVFESLREEVARMSRVVDNLLTLARIDGNQLDLLVAPTDLHDLATRCARTHAAAAEAAGVRIDVTGQAVTANCDADRTEQVLGNLLDNAIRVAPSGTAVAVHVMAAEAGARLSVTDDGPGVPPDLRDRIFERFARADPARGRSGGAGLGLPISREIATAHGGRLELTHTGPGGSTFTLTLPATELAAGDGPPDAARSRPGAPLPLGW